MNMVIPGIHSDTEEKDTEGPTHINSIVERQWGAEGGADLVEDTTSEEDMTPIR